MLEKLQTWLQVAPVEESATAVTILGNRPLTRHDRAMVLRFARTLQSAIETQLMDLDMTCENLWQGHRSTVEAYAMGIAFELCDQTEVADTSELVASIALAQLCKTPSDDAAEFVISLVARAERDSTVFVTNYNAGRGDARRLNARELAFGLQDSIANAGIQHGVATSIVARPPDDDPHTAHIVDAVLAQLGLAEDEGATTAEARQEVVVMGYVAGVSQRLCRANAMSPAVERLALVVLYRLYESSERSRGAIDEQFLGRLLGEDLQFRNALAAGKMDGARLEDGRGPALMLVDLLLG